MPRGNTLGTPYSSYSSKAVAISGDYEPGIGFQIYVGVTGDIRVDMERSGTVTFKNVPVGFMEIVASKVYATGTTASELISLPNA